MSASEVKLLGEAVNSFRLNFADVVNAPADEFLPAVEPDGMCMVRDDANYF